MVRSWEPGTEYNRGDAVMYNGHKFKCIQQHFSQSDWSPGVAQSLWGKCPDGDQDQDDDHRPEKQHHQHHDQPQHQDTPQYQSPPQPPPRYQNQPQHQTDDGSGSISQGTPPKPAEEKKASWFDRHKTELEVGGAALVGGGLLAAGYGLFKHHENSEKEEKSRAQWLHEAQARTNQFYNQGPQGPATWILAHGQNIPDGAIVVGREDDSTLYICRAFHEGGIQVGKASQAFKKGGVIGFKHDEIHVEDFEVLVGDMNALRWVPASGRLNVGALRYIPVEGGREDDGSALYIAEAAYDERVYPGKASEKLDGAYIPLDGTEKNVKEYRVLCYNKMRESYH